MEVVAVEAADLERCREAIEPHITPMTGVTSATAAPWIDANGWRFQREPAAQYCYESLSARSAPLAAAEAFVYGVRALLRVPEPGLAGYATMLEFLKKMGLEALPAVANFGIVDDGSDVAGEVMNLMVRKNLLFRVVSEAAPELDRIIRLGTPEYPLEAAADPSHFAALMRARLTDEKRLLRIYGTEVVLAHLTGRGTRYRLHLLNYSGRSVDGMRIRLLGEFRNLRLAIWGSDAREPLDVLAGRDAIEFTVPAMSAYAVADLERVR